jgi:hypothetical protein
MARVIAASNDSLLDAPLHANDSQRTDSHKTKPIIDYYMSWDLNESSRSLFIALSTSAETGTHTSLSAQSTTTTVSSTGMPVPDTSTRPAVGTLSTESSLSSDRQPHEDKHSVPALHGKSLRRSGLTSHTHYRTLHALSISLTSTTLGFKGHKLFLLRVVSLFPILQIILHSICYFS